MRSVLIKVHRLVLWLAQLATRRFTLPLEPWDLQLEQHEIDSQLAFGRD